ncbi:hypothetical protein ACE6H2_025619 [Prunus campanulata]
MQRNKNKHSPTNTKRLPCVRPAFRRQTTPVGCLTVKAYLVLIDSLCTETGS